MDSNEFDPRARTRELAAEFAERGDATGWFEALYQESAGNNELIPWADLAPNRYLRAYAELSGLTGGGRTAMVVGCGLGDDARYLYDLGFKVTAFDISPTAIEWAKELHSETDIVFEAIDLFDAPTKWNYVKCSPKDGDSTETTGFDLVVEVYTIQPLPLAMRPNVVDGIAAFVGERGRLIVVTRGREDDSEPDELPWPMSRRDLKRFEMHGLRQIAFEIMPGEEDEPDRFVVEYERA